MLMAGVLVVFGATALAQAIPNGCATAPADAMVSAAQLGTGTPHVSESGPTYGTKTCQRAYVVEYDVPLPAWATGLAVGVSPTSWNPGLTKVECDRLVMTARVWSFVGKWVPTGAEVSQRAQWSGGCFAPTLHLPSITSARSRVAVRYETLATDTRLTGTLSPVTVFADFIRPEDPTPYGGTEQQGAPGDP